MEAEDCVLSMGESRWLGSSKAVGGPKGCGGPKGWGGQGLSSMKLLFSPLLATASNDTLKKI